MRRPLAAVRAPPALLALALAGWGVGEAIVLDGAWPLAARVAFVLAVLLPIAAMDRAPRLVVAIVVAGTAVHVAFDVIELSVSPLQGIAVAGWIVGARIGPVRRSAGTLAGLVAVIVVATPGLGAFGVVVVCALGWAGARAVGGVRRRRAEAVAVLAALARGGEARREAAVVFERDRLARELDAAVLRATRAIEIDARRAAGLLDDHPDGARAALRDVAERAGAAMRQMRRALAMLGADGAEGGGVADRGGIESAVATLAAAGVRTTIRRDAPRRWRPALRGVLRGVRWPATGRAGPGAAARRRFPVADRGAEERRAALAAARVLSVVAAGPWRPAQVDVRIGRRATTIRVRTHGSAGPDERLALARIAERARLHGGVLRVRGRPWSPRATRIAVVELPTDGTASHRRAAAGLLAGALAGAATALDVATGHPFPVPPGAGPSVAAVGTAALATALVVGAAWTRRPWALAALALLPLPRGAVVGYVGLEVTTLPLVALAAYLGSAWLPRRPARMLVLVALAGGAVAVALRSWEQLGPSDVAILVFTIAVPWAVGAAVRDAAADAERLAGLRWATARDDLHAALAAVDDERRRVAADLHDLAGHGLALVSVQAWGAEQGLPADRRRAREAITAILRVVRSTATELELLLRPPDVPGAAPDVAALVAEAARAGLPVDLQSTRDGRPGAPTAVLVDVDAPTTVAVRRVVQEGLTNVLRHAGAVPTTVVLARTASTVEIVVRNAPGGTGAPGGGHGLAAMRGRVAALGGTLACAATDDGGFRLHAVLPARPRDGAAAAAPTTTADGPRRPRAPSVPPVALPEGHGALVSPTESIHPAPRGQGIRCESGTDAQR